MNDYEERERGWREAESSGDMETERKAKWRHRWQEADIKMMVREEELRSPGPQRYLGP